MYPSFAARRDDVRFTHLPYMYDVSLDLVGYKELLTPAVADSGAGESAAAGPGVGTVGLKKLWKSVTF